MLAKGVCAHAPSSYVATVCVPATITGTDNWTPIQNASRRKYYDVTKLLIESGCDIFVETVGSNPLVEAMASNEIENERLLREAGATEDAYLNTNA